MSIQSKPFGCSAPASGSVHLKDFDANSEEQIVGQGLLNLVDTFQALVDVGFKGPLSLEFESNMENPVPSMREGVAAAAAALTRM